MVPEPVLRCRLGGVSTANRRMQKCKLPRLDCIQNIFVWKFGPVVDVNGFVALTALLRGTNWLRAATGSSARHADLASIPRTDGMM